MATYVLIHGASSDSWYWHRVIPQLLERGHEVVAPDLPIDDDSAGLKDRFFPAEFMRRVVKERLDITPDEMESGHLPALAHPEELVDWLEGCREAHWT